MRVGIVGTGEMGRPLVDRLLAAGLEVTAFVRRPEVRDDLAAAGAIVVDDLGSMAADRDVVIVYVYTDAQVRDLVLDGGILDAMRPGSTLVIHTTSSPETAIAIAERASTAGISVLDAPGTGGPAQVADGTLTLFVGADADDFADLQPLLAHYSTRVVHFGPVGSGQRMKLLNNLLFGAHVQFAIEVGRLSAAMDLDEALVLSTMHGASGGSAAIDMAAAMGSVGQLLALAGRFVHKDVEVARSLADDLGIELGTLGPVTDRILELTDDEGTGR